MPPPLEMGELLGWAGNRRLLAAPGQIHVWYVNIRAEPALDEQCLAVLSSGERQRIQAVRVSEERDRRLRSVAALRLLLGAYMHRSPATVVFDTNEGGKPRLEHLPDSETRCRFNASHAGEVAAFAISADLEVGIDVEYTSGSLDLDAIARRSFAPAEFQAFVRSEGTARLQLFYRIWVRKEALVKAHGSGIRNDMNLVEVLGTGSPAACTVSYAGRTWRLMDVPAPEGHMGAIASEAIEPQIIIHGRLGATIVV